MAWRDWDSVWATLEFPGRGRRSVKPTAKFWFVFFSLPLSFYEWKCEYLVTKRRIQWEVPLQDIWKLFQEHHVMYQLVSRMQTTVLVTVMIYSLPPPPTGSPSCEQLLLSRVFAPNTVTPGPFPEQMKMDTLNLIPSEIQPRVACGPVFE